MASDSEASCVSDPNFAVICSFLECFGKSCGIDYPDIAMLQEMVENTQEVPQQLIDLHIKLLRKTRKTVTAEKWERALVKFCHTYSNQDGWELERFGYKKARIAVKLRLLKVLLEAQFDMNQRFKNEVNKLAANELRVEPLGRDKSGLAYWCQLDEDCNIRVYREDLDEESWQLVAKDREEVVNLISTLSNGEAGDIPVNEDSNSLEISEKPIIDTGQVTSSPSLDENRDNVGGEEKSQDEDLEDEEEEDDEEDEEEEGDDESLEQSTEEEESQDSKPEAVTKKVESLEATKIVPVSVETRGKVEAADREPKSIETTVIKTSPIKVVNIAELTKPQQEERRPDVKVPVGITLTPVAKPITRDDSLLSKTSIFYAPATGEPKLGQNKASLKPIDKLAANLVKMQAEKLEKPSGIKSLEKIAENLARSSLHGMVTSPEEDRQVPDFFPRGQSDKSSSRGQRGMDLSTSPRGWETLGSQDRNRPVDFSGIDLSSRKPAGKASEIPSPGYRAQNFQHKEIDLSTRKPGRPEASSLPFDARTISRSHGVITDLSKRQLPFSGYDMPQAYRSDHRLPNYTMLPDPSKIAANRLGGGSKRPLEDDDVHHDVAKRIHADVIPIRGTMEKRQQILGSNWREEVGEAIEEPVMMVQGEGSGSDCDGVNPGVGEAVDEPVLYFYGEGFGLECETGNPADEVQKPDSKESTKSDETGTENVEGLSQPGTSVTESLEGSAAGTESPKSDKARFKPTLGVQVFNKSTGSPVKRLSRWDVRRPTEKTNAEHEGTGPESLAKEPFKSQEDSRGSETLSTIRESTMESDDPSDGRTLSCDMKQSDVSEVEKREGESLLAIEEPCGHDSSTSIGAGLIKAIIPGLLAVPGAENIAEKRGLDHDSNAQDSALKSSSDTELPEGEEASESMPRFFFGPNCVSYNLKNDKTKDEPQTSHSGSVAADVKQAENESIVKLADDLAKSVSIDKTTESVPGEEDPDPKVDKDSTDSTDIPVPETVGADPVPRGEESLHGEIEFAKCADSTPVDERFEKLVVSEAETPGTSKSLDSISEDENLDLPMDDAKNETVEVNKSFEKLVVSEAEPKQPTEESNDVKAKTESLEESTGGLPSDKEDEDKTDRLISESESTEKAADSKPDGKPIDLPADTQSIEESSDSVDKAEAIVNVTESIDSIPQAEESNAKNVDESESIEKPALTSDSQIQDIEELIDSQNVDEEDSLPVTQSIGTAANSSTKVMRPEESGNGPEAQLSDYEEPEENLKPEAGAETIETVLPEEKAQETEEKEQKVEEPAQNSSGQINESQLAEELPESQTISDIGIINEDELLKSSSDSEHDQNVKSKKSNLEDEVLWSSQSEAAKKIEEKNENTVCKKDTHTVNENEDSQCIGALRAENETKVEEKTDSTVKESSAGESEKQENISESVEKDVKSVAAEDKYNEALDSLSEASPDNDRSQDTKDGESKEVKGDIKITEDTAANEDVDLEAEEDTTSPSKAPSIGQANDAETGDKSPAPEPEEDRVPKKDEFLVNKITPAAITDSNVSKSPERINVDAKNEQDASCLVVTDDYCDPASENPSSSADQDSNEAMVIDDRVYDSNESSKDPGNEDSALNDEKKLDDAVPEMGDAENKNEESRCFNLKNISGSSEQEATVSLPTERSFQAESDVEQLLLTASTLLAVESESTELKGGKELKNLTEDINEPVDKFTAKSDVEDIVENLTQDTSTDDQKSLVANYDSSDRESDDVFENDPLESASNADEFNDSKSDELTVEKDEEEDLLDNIDNETGNPEDLSNDVKINKDNLSNESTEVPVSLSDEIPEAKVTAVDMSLEKEKEDKSEDVAADDDAKANIEKVPESRPEDEIQETINEEKFVPYVEEAKASSENVKEVFSTKITVSETDIESGINYDDTDGREESITKSADHIENEIPVVKSVEEPGLDLTNEIPVEKSIQEAVEMNAKETEELEPIESLSNSTIPNLEKVEEGFCKSSENQVSEEKDEEKSVANELELGNASIAAKHSLEPDKNESDEIDEEEDEQVFEEEEQPVVHHSKRFKEDSNASILDSKKELEVISLFGKDVRRKDSTELTAASDPLNHSENCLPMEFENSKDPENLPTPAIKENKTDETKDTSFLEEANTSLPSDKVDQIGVTVVAESPGVREAATEKEVDKKMEEVPTTEDILTLKSKPPSFESVGKSNASATEDSTRFVVPPQNSVSEVMTTCIEELRKPEIQRDRVGKIQLLDGQMTKKIVEDEASEIQSVNLGVVTIESDDSMGTDNEDCFSNPQDDVDPLACIEDPLARPEDSALAAALGIRVKPVSELVYEGWKLDGTETPKISRKRRNSNHESNSEDVAMKEDDDESEGTGGKRMRLRGKRPPDMNLRRTIEEKRQEAASSDDETSKKPTDMVKEEAKAGDDVPVVDSVGNDKKTRGRPRGKRKVRRTIRLPGRPPNSGNQSLGPDSSMGTEPAEVLSSPVISSDTPQKKRKKRKMVLGLEIGRDIVDTSQGGVDLNETPVRQSRRIAQIKIKEEADRRRIEEETLCEMKEKKDRDYVVGGSGDKRKRKKQKAESEEEVSSKEVELESKAKKKRKKKKRKKKPSSTKFDEQNPWRSSSGSSTEDEDDQEEDDDEDEEAESEGSVLFKSDHEFSPESDLEKDEESEPMRRARTAQKAQSDVEEAEDEYACQKCGKADHPEWILLCDTCDKGWHCSCLRPALMLIPEGDWFCPPCQHNLLVLKLQENLKKFDQNTKKHENELLRKKRLAFVGISLDNVLHQKESHRSERRGSRGSRGSSQDSDNDSSSSPSSSSQSGSSSSEESEPVYQLRERRCANTYKFNEYDDMINAAIQDEVEAVRGAGNQGRGKDIATIVNAEKEEAQAEALKINQEEIEEDEEDDGKLDKESDEDYKAEKDEDAEDDEDEDDKPKVSAKKTFSRKKHRKLNSLDISSEDDPESDEDFKGSSSDEDEDPEDQASSSDDSCFDTRRRGRRSGAPVRRSTRARMTRYDEDFINDDSEDSDRPKRKKSRSVWDESESEESDNSWRQRKKRSKTVPTPKSRSANKSKSKKRRKKKQVIESDNQSENEEEVEPVFERNPPGEQAVAQLIPDSEEPAVENEEKIAIQNTDGAETEQPTEEIKEESKEDIVPVLPNIEYEKIAAKKKETTPKRKKTPPIRRKIVYGGLQDSYPQQEEETLGRRTRGKKINYQEVLASDSEEELKKALKKTEESEDEFVVNEVEDLNEEAEKDSDSGDIYSPKKEGPKLKGKSPKGKKPRKSKSPAASLKLGSSDNDTPKARKKPGPKPGSKNKPRSQKMTPPFGNPRSGGEEGDVTEEGSLAGLGAEELAELDEEQLDQMMMEDEEYGKRQLELAAIEIARKKKEEREAKKLEKARLKALEILAAERQRDPNAPEGTDGETPKKKKRGRRSKAEILAEQMRRDGAPSLSMESLSPNLSTAILSPGLNLSTTPIVSPGAPTPSLPPSLTSPNLSAFLNPNAGLNLAPNLTAAMVPNLPPIPILDNLKIPESLAPGVDAHAFSPDGMLGVKPKRRGRGKGKKTLALEAARAAEAAAKGVDHLSGFGTDSNPEVKSDDPSVLPTPGSSTSGSAPSTPPACIVGATQVPPSTQSQQPPVTTIQQTQSYPTMPPTAQQQSSVITRMLQAQPVSGGPQSFAAAAAAMGHKYFGAPNTAGNIMGVPRPGFDLQPRGRIPSPYRQPGQSPMPPHFAAVRSGTPPMRMRVPGPQMYHTPHHPMDPSPSGGGPISITSSRDRSSPSGAGLGPAMIPPAAGSPLTKGGPTPPPPPYVRGVPQMGRFPDSSVMGPRHQIPPFANASGANHGLQQPSPPPNRASGNFSPYHPPPPPNYHYGAYPPPPPMTTADDAAAYQGSPYPAPEHFSTPSENPGPPQPPPPPQPQPQSQPHSHPGEPGQGNKQFDEEGTGEFGGLVSYFSSQREDDLDS